MEDRVILQKGAKIKNILRCNIDPYLAQGYAIVEAVKPEEAEAVADVNEEADKPAKKSRKKKGE